MTKSHDFPGNRIFARDLLEKRLDAIIERTLGEVDVNGIFEATRLNPKITGIAGSVIEQSVLGYEANSDQQCDILVDSVETEVKTTGIKESGKGNYVAKEPMSITAVSPATIVNENFDESHFWNKLAHMLLIYYLYDSKITVKASDYANFTIKGYEFHEFSEEDKTILKNDWTLVCDFIRYLQRNYEKPTEEYPRLSHELREQLMYIDTAPKWPNPPRFRLKRSVVDSIVQNYFDHKSELPEIYSKYADIDLKCHELSKQYNGKTVKELTKLFDIEKISKSVGEQIVVKMFGGSVKKLNDIELFRKIGLHGKTVTLSCTRGRTEDSKLFAIDFDELLDKDKTFEDSEMYDYFADHQFICIMFEEKNSDQNYKDNKFLGFKRISFDEDFIYSEVKRTWDDIRDTIFKGNLVETTVFTNGVPKKNANGQTSTSINFPKSRTHKIFVRGSGIDSSCKPEKVAGISMYKQFIWIKGDYFVSELEKKKFL